MPPLRTISAAAFLALTFTAAALAADLPPLNKKVLDFAVAHKKQQVGNGQCWTLAAEALKHAGAKPPHHYDFGKEIPPKDALPGDIIQFERAEFKTAHTHLTAHHHTAIVESADGKKFTMLSQNHGGNLTVGTQKFNLEDLKSGTVKFFRPQPRRST